SHGDSACRRWLPRVAACPFLLSSELDGHVKGMVVAALGATPLGKLTVPLHTLPWPYKPPPVITKWQSVKTAFQKKQDTTELAARALRETKKRLRIGPSQPLRGARRSSLEATSWERRPNPAPT